MGAVKDRLIAATEEVAAMLEGHDLAYVGYSDDGLEGRCLCEARVATTGRSEGRLRSAFAFHVAESLMDSGRFDAWALDG